MKSPTYRFPSCSRLGCSSIVLLSALLVRSSSGETVKLKNGQSVTGQILSYDDRGIEIRMGTGRNLTKIYSTDDIDSIDAEFLPQHESAMDAAASGEFRKAAQEYIAAFKAEERNWVKTWIRVELLHALLGAGELRKAAELYFEIAKGRDDPQILALAPLLWTSESIPKEDAAEYAKRWIQEESPLAQLVGASWLLDTDQRDQAKNVLTALATNPRPEIAALASSQLWRPRSAAAKVEEIARFEKQIETLPEMLRFGPTLLLASAYSKVGVPEDAALAYVRVTVLGNAPPHLVMEALYHAAIESQKAGFADDAKRLFAEVVKGYPGTPIAQEAATQLGKTKEIVKPKE